MIYLYYLKMRTFSFILIISFSSIHLVTVQVQQGLSIKLPLFSDKVITTSIIFVREDVSRIQCMLLCLEIQACVSVFYRRMIGTCQLHDVLFMNPDDGEKEKQTEYYSLTTASCHFGYINARHRGICYQQHLRKLLYDDCVADCSSRGEHLIVIDSQEKQDHIQKQVTSSSDLNGGIYYIDGSDAATEGQWVYHDGQPMTYFAWEAGFPLNATGRNYLTLNKNNHTTLWKNRKKAFHRYFLCQKDI